MLKRKALTTGFFDSRKIKHDGRKGVSCGGGLVFGQPLEKCLSNDFRTLSTKQLQSGSGKADGRTRSSLTSLKDKKISGEGHRKHTVIDIDSKEG